MPACVAAYRATVVIVIDDQGQLVFAYNNYLVATKCNLKLKLQLGELHWNLFSKFLKTLYQRQLENTLHFVISQSMTTLSNY